jgi:adenosine deaminase
MLFNYVRICQVGSEDPLIFKSSYDAAKEGGVAIVNVHVGEWSPERETGIETQKQWIRNAVAIGASRIGHGIIAHLDPEIMSELKEKDICLEICPFSNAYLDNVPGGLLANHPLPILHRAGVPCCLSSDDPWQMGTMNSHGLVREYEIARDKLGMSNVEIAQLAKNSFKYSLAPENLKEQAYRDIDDWLQKFS